MSPRRILLVLAAVTIPAVAGIALALSGAQRESGGGVEATDSCDSELLTGRTECLEAQLRELAVTDPAAALALYHSAAETHQRVRESCHALFHEIGHGAVQSGQSTWDLLLLGSSECNWGYVHGVVEELLGHDAEQAIATAAETCTIPSDLDSTDPRISGLAGNCVHGTGHALFLATGDPIAAEAGCLRAFSEKYSIVSCVDGVIMEFGGSAAALEGKFADLCERISDIGRSKCYETIALTWYNQLGREFEPVLARCESAGTEAFIRTCIRGATNLFTAMSGFDIQQTSHLCEAYTDVRRASCFIGVATSGAQGVNNGSIDAASFASWMAAVSEPAFAEELRREVEKATASFGTPS